MADSNDTAPARPLAVVVLAAGKGTRMRSDVPKVLHTVLGRSVIGWVLDAVGTLGADRTVVVVGHGADAVRDALPSGVETAVQTEQLGSGHAVAAALPALEGIEGDVLVVNGDGALFTAATLAAVVAQHRAAGSAATALAIPSHENLPYGRVFVTADAQIERIVEAADASPQELANHRLNAGVYAFDIGMLREACPQLSADNSKGEYYITDLLGIARDLGGRTLAVEAGSPDELLGVNTHADLAQAEQVLQARIARDLMLAGVAMSMPATCRIDPEVRVEPGARIEPGTILRGHTTVAAGATVGPYSVLTDTAVERDATVVQSTCVGARVGAGATVGPYGYLRPGSVLQQGAKVGTFVELKNTTLGPRSKVPHLSYVGDATVGSDSNVGAGNITANYRPELGAGKQRTRIGSGVRTGSDNVFVAPVTLGDGCFTGAGSIIVQDVPAGALAIARARQVNLQDYAQRLERSPEEETGDSHRHLHGADGVGSPLPDDRG